MDPVTDADLLARSVLGHSLEIAASLRRLARHRAPVRFHPAGGGRPWTSWIDSVDTATGRLNLQPPRFATSAEAEEVRSGAAAGGLLVGELDGVRMQFVLEHVEPQRAATGWLLSAAMPVRAWRIQRRDRFRVRPPVEGDAMVRVRTSDGFVEHVVEDVSEEGLRLRIADDGTLPTPGALWHGAWVDLPDVPMLRVDLYVRRIDIPPPPRPRTVGCVIAGLDDDHARALRRWITDRQVRDAALRKLDEAFR